MDIGGDGGVCCMCVWYMMYVFFVHVSVCFCVCRCVCGERLRERERETQKQTPRHNRVGKVVTFWEFFLIHFKTWYFFTLAFFLKNFKVP